MRLYTTVIRFDAVYVQHFKCNVRDIRSGYPALHRWVRMLYWDVPAFGETTQFEHIKRHYTRSHLQINPFVGILVFVAGSVLLTLSVVCRALRLSDRNRLSCPRIRRLLRWKRSSIISCRMPRMYLLLCVDCMCLDTCGKSCIIYESRHL